MDGRRHFLKQFSGLSLGLGVLYFDPALILEIKKAGKSKSYHPEAIDRDEDYWKIIRKAFKQSEDFINLENGYFSPQPIATLKAQAEYINMINEIPAFYMRRKQHDDKVRIKKKVADFAGVLPEEIVITRNTTESLDTILAGLDLKEGEEFLTSNQDYSSMLQALDQQNRRFGIKTRIIEFPLLPKSKMEIVKAFEKGITEKTKYLLMSHVVNATGTVLPAREVAEMAHQNGVEVILDAAHSFAHLEYKIPDLKCDYFGASLHKWLSAPLGAGLLYIQKDKIKNVWPLFGDATYEAHDIRKLEHIGTHPVSTNLTLENALEFHHAIGSNRKQARFRYLKSYWTEKVKEFNNLRFNTPLQKEFSSAITNIAIDGLEPKKLADILLEKYGIYTTRKYSDAVDGVRITPHLFTSLEELDQLVQALKEITQS